MQNPSSPKAPLLKFRHEYLERGRNGNSFLVNETRDNRYLPNNPGKFSENLLQLIWRNGLFESGALKTTLGLDLKIITPGRLNRAAGPDFKNASFEIGGEKVNGDVEIHKEAGEWREHGHQRSKEYNGTALHVFAKRGDSHAPATTNAGKIIPELELGLYLRHSVETLNEELDGAQKPTTGRTNASAPCARLLRKMTKEDLANLLDLVGDGRMLLKSNRIIDASDGKNPDEMLYETIFECMGNSQFNKQFGRLVRKAGLQTVSNTAKQNPGVPPHICAQSTYLGLAGMIDAKKAGEYERTLGRVKIESFAPMFTPAEWSLSACRPANYPARRLAALSHLAGRFCGETKISAFFGSALDGLPANAPPADARMATKRLMGVFMEISDPFWDVHYSISLPVRKPKKLVGRDKAISLVTDALIPFFLAECRAKNDAEREHKLVMIYKSLPPPASSGITDYVARNMLGENRDVARPLRRQQALLQLYKDFCHRAPAYCPECPFVDYLKAFAY